MGQESSFQQILESKMQEGRPSRQSKTQQTVLLSEPWTQLIGHFSPLRAADSAVSERLSTKAYAAFRPQPKVRPKHQFSGEQAAAYGFFKASGGELDENFTKKDLLRAFRRLALQLHPDQGGSAQQFQTLVRSRATLQGLFT
jgi:hypothetical protein